ncbi:MAG: ABC transporter substrate-binding protein [Candidatus Methanomethyliaceae archaeon]
MFKVVFAIVAISLLLTFQYTVASERYVFCLDWVVYGRHAPYYVALAKGFYAARGLDIEIVQGYGSYDTIKRVGLGEATFGFADMGSLIIARSEGIQVKCIGMVYHKAPYVIFFLARSGIQQPKDLENRTIAATAGEAPRKIFPVFAQINGVDNSKISWLIVAAEAKIPLLLTHKVDAIAEYVLTRPLLANLAAEQGEEVREILLADHGVDIYSNGLIVADNFARQNPGAVKNFVEATFEGFVYTFTHTDEAVRILLQYKPILDPEVALSEIDILRELMELPDSRRPHIGWMEESKVRRTIELISEAYELTIKLDPHSVYTNDYLPPIIK